ncbi:hypothetical protein NDI39_18060 [Microcoleus sp. ZQ-A2]|nr:hypothetical protein [Microcoleus sp. FACHB-1]
MSLKTQVLREGTYLLLRQGLGVIIRPLAKVKLTSSYDLRLNPPDAGGINLAPSPFRGGLGRGFSDLCKRSISFVGEILSFVKIATGRISIATLARLQGNRERRLKAVSEGIGLQILALGPLLAVVS